MNAFFVLFWMFISVTLFYLAIVVQNVIYNMIFFSSFVYYDLPFILIFGVIEILVIVFIIYAIARKNYKVMTLVGSITLVMFCMGLIGGIISHVSKEETKNYIGDHLNSTIRLYYENPRIKTYWDGVQNNKCCGVEGPQDWENLFGNDTIPLSCCRENNTTCQIEETYHVGCATLCEDYIRKSYLFLIIVSAVLIIAQLVFNVYSCIAMRNRYDEENDSDNRPVSDFQYRYVGNAHTAPLLARR